MLDLGEVILGIAIQDQPANFDQRIITMRPNLGDIEDVESIILRLLERHDLHFQRPARMVTPVDRIVQIFRCMIGTLPGQAGGFLPREVLDALVGFEMILHPEGLALRVVPFEGVAAVAVHMAVRGGRAPVGEQDRDLVDGFRREGKEVPEHVGIRAIRGRMPFLRVDKIGELQGIADKEDGRVIAHEVVIAVLRIEFYCETARIARRIRGAFFAAHGRKPGKDLGSLTHFREEFSFRVFCHVRRNLEIASGPGSFGVDDPLGNAFTVKMRQFFEQMGVLHQHGPARTGGHRVLIVADRYSECGG